MRAMCAAFFALLASALPAFALTMTPYVAVQATCPYCFYPDPVAVVVRDGTLPAPGVQVTFSAAANSFIPNAGNGPWTVVTNSQGFATPPSPGFVGETAGSSMLTATSVAGTVSFELTVAGSPPASLVPAGSIAFTGMVNAPYSQRMMTRAFDAAGQFVPYAAVAYGVPAPPGPSLTFEQGTNVGFGTGTSLGFSIAPVMTANGTTGHGQATATLLNGAASTTFDYYNSAAGVASIEPLAGTTPQTTRVFALFPQTLGARVRDAAGNPVANAAVRFTVPFISGSGFGFFLTEPGSTDEAIVMTGADGIAMGPARVLATVVGAVPYTADVPGAPVDVRYALDAVEGPAVRFTIVSGNNQSAIVNTTYELPWTLRAVAADGSPVPYAAVLFSANPSGSVPSGLFGGRSALYVMADSQGIAVSPPFTANGVTGGYFGTALGFAPADATQAPFALFDYRNLPADVDVQLLDLVNVPLSLPVGGALWTPLRALVTDKLGRGVPGMGVTWFADPSCGRFAGQVSYRGVTDWGGMATSPAVEGFAPRVDCLFSFTADAATYAVGATMHVFAPESLVFAEYPAGLDTFVNASLTFSAKLYADGLPVYYPAEVFVTTGKSGATARVTSFAQTLDGLLRIGLLANGKLGTYGVVVRAGPASADIPVTQKNKPH